MGKKEALSGWYQLTFFRLIKNRHRGASWVELKQAVQVKYAIPSRELTSQLKLTSYPYSSHLKRTKFQKS